MQKIRTDTKLLDLLDRAAKVRVSPEDRRKQRISFIHGGLGSDSTLSYADIDRLLSEHEGTRQVA